MTASKAISRLAATVVVTASAMFLSACDAASSSVPSSSPVTPSIADVSAAIAFDHFKNSLGDPLEAINLRITTNIPVDVRIQVHLDPPSNFFAIHTGADYEKCISDGCLVTGKGTRANWWCSNDCPRGLYGVTLDVCSYAENKDGFGSLGIRCNHQQAEYLEWVGKLGANLTGNPLATHDPDHSAVVNLRRQLTFGRTADGRVASPAEVEAAQKHVEAIKSVDHDLGNALNQVGAACNGDAYSAPCQQTLQGIDVAVDQAEATIRAASLPCSANVDAKYVQTLESVKAAIAQLLAASRSRNASAYNAAAAGLRALQGPVSSSHSAALDAACP